MAAHSARILGVAQRGRFGTAHAVYKLYVHPTLRGRGLGSRLLAALIDRLPPGTDPVYLEHFAANRRAGDFYDREGFTIDRVASSPSGEAERAIVWRVRSL